MSKPHNRSHRLVTALVAAATLGLASVAHAEQPFASAGPPPTARSIPMPSPRTTSPRSWRTRRPASST
ncbi:MAG: hypothetical protein U5L11_06960 [Arhodomonas sp.]|nr:hypothetical protein [Arhodomonas sp.]